MTRFAMLAVPVNSRSQDLGGFRETFDPRALRRTLDEHVDLRALKNHDPGLVLARSSAGTLQVRIDHRGLHALIDADSAISYVADLARSVARGDTSGASFAFRALDVEWVPEDPPLRRVLDALITEVSAVTFPAYLNTNITVSEAPRSYSPPREDRATRRHDDVDTGLELAAPRPHERRDLALAELEQARRWWQDHPGEPLTLRYSAPRRSRPLSLAMARNIQKQAEAESL